jgi:hypothetical protein
VIDTWMHAKRNPFGLGIWRMMSSVVLATSVGFVCGPAARCDSKATAPEVDFNRHIRPILADRCFKCHGPDEANRKADLRLDTPDGLRDSGVIVPGDPDESELIGRITATDNTRMPPPKSNLHLTPREIELLNEWVKRGAEYRPHWAFVPPPDLVPMAQPTNRTWSRNPIDEFILARLEREDFRPSAPATKEAWIRRVTFDLTGLPPTPMEIDQFLADSSPDAFEKVVDRLLASPHFGERMALEWLDVARYADSFGYQADGDTHVWPWRDWVVDAFNLNLTFDAFVTWQLAGDLLPNATLEQRLATAFCRLNRMTNEGGSIPEEFRCEYVADRVQTFATAFLSITMECARCHDHKFDPFTMKDYYSLAAFFGSIDEWGTYNDANFRPTPTLLLPTPEQDRQLCEQSAKVGQLVDRLEDFQTRRQSEFQKWLMTNPQPVIPGLVGHYPLDRAAADNQLENVADSKAPGTTSAANTFVPGRVGNALEFTGDDPVNFPTVLGAPDRGQPFTVAFWIQLTQALKQAIVFHRMSGTDTGFNGTELSTNDGRLFFALVRFWPGNAVAVETQESLPIGQWAHVVVTYDGSGRAGGMAIYLNGRPATCITVRDCLYKNVESGGSGFTFGERFRSPGLKRGRIDDVRIYARALTAVEAAHVFDGKALTEAIAHKDASALKAYYHAAIDPQADKLRGELEQARKQWFTTQTGVFEIMTMQELPHPRPTFILTRGQYDASRNRPVDRDTPTVLGALPHGAPRDRLGLARWLTDPRHPLTARVAVNRFWQLFFGRGIVVTTENFGLQGAEPDHPELLDWLARQFIRSRWDTKQLCRMIALSQTYRQQSAASAEYVQRDPENVLLARGPRRRLSAEMLRDAALHAGGLLVDHRGGPPVKPYQPPGLWRGQNAFLPEYEPDKGQGLYRRSLYTFWRRTSPPPNMIAFDAPTREVCLVRRQTTSTPIQPLVLLNDPQFVEAARAMGECMLRQPGRLADKVTYAFRTICTRRPLERELAVLIRLYVDQLDRFRADPEAARRYLVVGERRAPSDLDPLELAAAAATASTILNLDAALMVR